MCKLLFILNFYIFYDFSEIQEMVRRVRYP